jgi:superfamily II DNA or RNA helicase
MTPRYYQIEAIEGSAKHPGIFKAWRTWNKVLLVMPTGTGKTAVFSFLAERLVSQGARVLIIAHRDELIRQAQTKLEAATGIVAAIEKADECAAGCMERVIVASVQTLLSPARRDRIWAPTHIIVDEAHHAVSDSYLSVLRHWPCAKVLGVTATPDRGDLKDLGVLFEAIAYEYSLPQAVHDGFLARIKALTLPIKIDLTGMSPANGDWSKEQCATALDPYIPELCKGFADHARDRKGLVFVPLCATGKKVVEAFKAQGLRAYYCDGDDRSQIAPWENDGPGSVMVNAMLLTEGFDHPPIDALSIWRFTRSRPFYCQMCGRGTRIHPGKDHLLLIDNLYLTHTHELCRPAALWTADDDIAEKMTERQEREPGGEMELTDEELEQARQKVIADREASLAKKLAEMRHRKRDLVDPLQFAMSIGKPDLASYQAALPAEMRPASESQIDALAKCGINPSDIESSGHADAILQAFAERRDSNLAQPRQIRILERYGFKNVGQMEMNKAQAMIRRIAANGWRLPAGMARMT